MPPYYSEDEEGSEVELDAPATTKLATREKKKAATSYTEPPLEIEDDLDDQGDDGADDGDDAGDGEEEEEYVVEKIMSHIIKDGVPLFEVKWEGYEAESDRTWEPEDNLRENASQVLSDYLESIGGREAMFKRNAHALKTKKRGRPSQGGTPSASGKRARKNGDHGSDSDTPVSAKQAEWKPPAGSWEDHISNIDACQDELTNSLMVYLTWKNGHKTQHKPEIIYQRCPQKMLRFYERHVRIIQATDTNPAPTPDGTEA